MSLQEKIEEIFDRGISDDGSSLPPNELPYYQAWRFILEWEMNLLNGYFYNNLPNVDYIKAQAEALQVVGLKDLSLILRKALVLFDGYEDPTETTTWEVALQKFDPDNQLKEFDDQIGSLDNYGIET